MLARPPHDDRFGLGLAPARRYRDAPPPREISAGDRSRLPKNVVDRALGDDLAAMLPCSRTDVDDPVGGADGLLVVLDDKDGVPQIAHPEQGADEPGVVPLVQADRGFVEDVEHPHQA